MKRILELACAKINLVLEVLRRRPDGYHELRTVLHTLELADCLEISPGQPGVRLLCSHPEVPGDESNLVVRAARLLAAEAGIEPAVQVRLLKRIPVAAGLGGGSSDAAAALRGLSRFWRLRLPGQRLYALARALGSDVPFLLAGGCALGAGRGDRLTPWPAMAGLHVVLVNPGFTVSTAEVYKKLNLQLTRPTNYINLMRPAIAEKNLIKIGQNLFNRLESVTLIQFPELVRIKEELLACGATAALMSGSGPTVFGLVPNATTGRRVQKTLRTRYPFVRLTRTI